MESERNYHTDVADAHVDRGGEGTLNEVLSLEDDRIFGLWSYCCRSHTVYGLCPNKLEPA